MAPATICACPDPHWNRVLASTLGRTLGHLLWRLAALAAATAEPAHSFRFCWRRSASWPRPRRRSAAALAACHPPPARPPCAKRRPCATRRFRRCNGEICGAAAHCCAVRSTKPAPTWPASPARRWRRSCGACCSACSPACARGSERGGVGGAGPRQPSARSPGPEDRSPPRGSCSGAADQGSDPSSETCASRVRKSCNRARWEGVGSSWTRPQSSAA